MKKGTVTISLLIMLFQAVLFAKTDASKSKPHLVLDEQNNVLSAKTDSNNSTKSQTELDAQLWEAVNNFEDFNSIKQSLDAGANPNYVSQSISVIKNLLYSTVLIQKENKCLRALNLLFDAGAKLQRCDFDILFFPISEGFPKVVSLLIDKGADPNTTMNGLSPVEWAEYYGQPEVVSVLIERGAAPISRREAAQLRLVQCASSGDLAGIKTAILNGADINGKINDGRTALTEAVKPPGILFLKDVMAVDYLLENGANPDIVDERGDHPLHIVIFFSADICNRNDPNNARLIEAQECFKMTIEALLRAGAKVSARNKHEQTPLHIAAKWNNLWGAKKLIDSGAKLMDRDDSGKTPLDYAESAEMIKLLKSHDATEQ